MFKRWWNRNCNLKPEQSNHQHKRDQENPIDRAHQTKDDAPLIITINGLRYDQTQLPADVLAMIEDVRMADAVIQLKRDRMALLSSGARQLGLRLRRGLSSVPELNSQARYNHSNG